MAWSDYPGVLKKYAVFSGRASREEYWSFTFINFLIMAAFMMVVVPVFGVRGLGPLQVVLAIYALAILVPSIAVAARRLHDIGKSAWFLLINFIPTIGPIILVVLFVLDSTPGTNAYGPNPKGVQAEGQPPAAPSAPPADQPPVA